MEILAIILFIVLLVITLTTINSLKSQHYQDTAKLLQRLEKIESLLKNGHPNNLPVDENPIQIKEQVVETAPPIQETVRPPEIIASPADAPKIVEEPEPLPPPISINTPPVSVNTAPESAKDYEQFIGGNVAGKIGIAILVLGIGFFVKYAIDRDLINETGRVLLGFVCGGALLGIAHWLRNKYRAFSSVLVAGGIATFYFTATIAFQQYAMFSKSAAFGIMVAITSLCVLLSVQYDRKELAAMALIGGFAAPFMVHTGQSNYGALFTYVLILDVGMLVLAYLKRWNSINTLAFAGTVLLYSGWLVNDLLTNDKQFSYGLAFLFASLFFVVFFVMNIVRQVFRGENFTAFQTGLLFFISFLYFSVGMYLLESWGHRGLQGIFTASLALFNLVFGILFYRKVTIDKKLVLYLFGLVMVFVSIVAPVQFSGNHITLFWAAEAAMLLWFSRRANMQLAKNASLVITCLMLASLVMDWLRFYIPGAAALPLIINKITITGLVCFVSLGVSRYLLKKDTLSYQLLAEELSNKLVGVFLDVMMALVALCIINTESLFQLTLFSQPETTRFITILLINNVWLLTIMAIVYFRRSAVFSPVMVVLGVVALGINCLFQWPYFSLFKNMLLQGSSIQPGFGLHYISLVCIAGILIFTFLLSKEENKTYPQWVLWAGTFFTVFTLSRELSLHGLYINRHHLSTLYGEGAYDWLREYNLVIRQCVTAGFPVLWGLCGFTLMWLGMRLKNRDLRIIALSLITLTIFKLFVYDIRGISEGGRIVAFIILGIVLLVISFMYQKIKNIILQGETETPDSDSQ